MNNGKQLEQLVHLIEKSIAPDSKVEHNVELPIINSSIGATAQCDIVVTTGKYPRQTITLIEVQDRGSKVKINDFRGWQVKLDDVGAQHLICVSKQEFTKSIKEQASLSGKKIMLITLKEGTPDSFPLDFINFIYRFIKFEVTEIINIQPTMSKSEVISLGVSDEMLKNKTIDINEHCWSLDQQNLVNLYSLCRDNYFPPKGEIFKHGKDKFQSERRATTLLCS